jgi:TRAP transporter TAXI family solute receptor
MKNNQKQGYEMSRNYLLKIQLLSLAALAITCLAIGCTSDAGTKTGDNSGTKTDSGKRQFITIGTAPAGGVFSLVGSAIANTLEANKGDLNWNITAQGTKGTQENIRKLVAGEIEFGMANAAISYFATRGEGAWEKPRDVRVVATLAPNVGVFVTTKSTGIKTIEDLKGKRVVLGPSGAGFDYFLKPLLAAHGLSYDDLEVLNGNYLTAGEMLADGKADAAFMGGAPPVSAVTSLCSTQDVVFVKLADNVADKLKEYPFYFPVPIKAGVYTDLTEDLMGINVGNMHLVSHASVSDEVVYNVTKLVYENRAGVAEQHPAGKAINPKNVIRDTGTPFHPGAIKYYTEIGLWPTADAEGENTSDDPAEKK